MDRHGQKRSSRTAGQVTSAVSCGRNGTLSGSLVQTPRMNLCRSVDRDHGAILGSAITLWADTLAHSKTLEPWQRCTLDEREENPRRPKAHGDSQTGSQRSCIHFVPALTTAGDVKEVVGTQSSQLIAYITSTMRFCCCSNRRCQAGPPALLNVSFLSGVLKTHPAWSSFDFFKKKMRIQMLLLCSCGYYPVSFIWDCCLSAWL